MSELAKQVPPGPACKLRDGVTDATICDSDKCRETCCNEPSPVPKDRIPCARFWLFGVGCPKSFFPKPSAVATLCAPDQCAKDCCTDKPDPDPIPIPPPIVIPDPNVPWKCKEFWRKSECLAGSSEKPEAADLECKGASCYSDCCKTQDVVVCENFPCPPSLKRNPANSGEKCVGADECKKKCCQVPPPHDCESFWASADCPKDKSRVNGANHQECADDQCEATCCVTVRKCSAFKCALPSIRKPLSGGETCGDDADCRSQCCITPEPFPIIPTGPTTCGKFWKDTKCNQKGKLREGVESNSCTGDQECFERCCAAFIGGVEIAPQPTHYRGSGTFDQMAPQPTHFKPLANPDGEMAPQPTQYGPKTEHGDLAPQPTQLGRREDHHGDVAPQPTHINKSEDRQHDGQVTIFFPPEL